MPRDPHDPDDIAPLIRQVRATETSDDFDAVLLWRIIVALAGVVEDAESFLEFEDPETDPRDRENLLERLDLAADLGRLMIARSPGGDEGDGTD